MQDPADSLSPDGLKVAGMLRSGAEQNQALDRGNGVYENQGIGSSYLVTTPEGNVLVNAGALKDARRGIELFARVTDQPGEARLLGRPASAR